MKTANLINNSHYKHYLTNNNVKTSATNTTAGENPSGRLSFKGRADVAEKLAKTKAGKLVQNKAFNWFLKVTEKNSLLADALIALGLTAVLRPASIYAIPTKDKEDKRKNNYQVAHSVATGVMGLATTYIVAQPISKAVDMVFKNPEKYMKKNTEYLKESGRVFKETSKRLHQPIFLPLRAALTIMLVPALLKMFGLTKNGKTDIKPSEKAKIDYSYMNFKGGEKKMFKNFSSINKAFDAPKSSEAKKNNNPSFKGAGHETLAKGIGKLAQTNKYKEFIEWFGKKNFFPHLIAAESLWLSGFYMQQTAKSKKIEKDQKLPMILNQGITAVLCTIGAYKLDGVINKKLKRLQKVYRVMNPAMDQELLKKRLTGIRLLGPVLIFTTIYRFIGPVVVTPIANKISEMIQPHKKSKQQQPATAAAK